MLRHDRRTDTSRRHIIQRVKTRPMIMMELLRRRRVSSYHSAAIGLLLLMPQFHASNLSDIINNDPQILSPCTHSAFIYSSRPPLLLSAAKCAFNNNENNRHAPTRSRLKSSVQILEARNVHADRCVVCFVVSRCANSCSYASFYELCVSRMPFYCVSSRRKTVELINAEL